MTVLTAATGLSGSPAAVDPDAARASAREILDGSKYQEQSLPRPFKGVLEWMADGLRPVFSFIEDVLEPIGGLILGLPGGRFILVAVILAPVVALMWWLAGRRSRAAVRRSSASGLVDLRSDPAELEREADRAEADGDHATAVRRRYEAGLIRLVRSDRLELRPATTPGAAARQLSEPAMDQLTSDFEQIVYGDRDANAEDSTRARNLWGDLLGVKAGR